ncbi:MAG: DUF3124 domain-containing protein [Betaproteobacteria bacterium]|nr:DUF3124 domain-containing protein [Betaproteobacteria bacterium]
MQHEIVRPILKAVLVLLGAAMFGLAAAQVSPTLAQGQVLYLPVYSHIYHGDLDKQGKPFQTLLSAHVSIRNTNPQVPLKILYARYYDTDGKLLKEFVPAPVSIPPLGTHELFVPRSDVTGGSGANFLISWSAAAAVNPPLVEALHADIQPARTLIFVTTARPIHPY